MRASPFTLFLLGSALFGCGHEGQVAAPSVGPGAAPPVEVAAPYVDAPAAWGVFHSKRQFMTVHLPEGRAWHVDDHTRPELTATHPATHSALTVLLEPAGDLVGRDQCEAIARKKGRVPASDLRTLESHVTVGPEAYDTRIWVALEVQPGGQLKGHLFAFGGMIRTCFFFHLETSVASLASEGVLSSRLALARTRILDRVELDPPRVTSDADLPREKEGAKK